jgi:hypothetical protein
MSSALSIGCEKIVPTNGPMTWRDSPSVTLVQTVRGRVVSFRKRRGKISPFLGVFMVTCRFMDNEMERFLCRFAPSE